MNELDGVEVDVRITRIVCGQCDAAIDVVHSAQGEQFVGAHPGHLLTYTGMIIEPPLLQGQMISVQIVAPDRQVH
jgi:hypothetical protein